jgi:hypothetical protein
MSPEAQRIAIAVACGYTDVCMDRWEGVDIESRSISFGTELRGTLFKRRLFVPDYLHDLNAMHKAEEVLPDMASDDDGRDQLGYMETLADTLLAKWSSNNSADMWLITHATAAQRAEAFLRTIGKWEGQP